ncbi:hypothetical protein HMPREF9004_1521 [Schaalia cardiffensis F0333]|uniref:Uncharacterized protein n=1 Tax=Schaalia cardiffensis F0333 TaxID=888050 RepID=N6X1F3_9ACTO|nr:hypothetical protein HMPREF9004_1521 [Schaalia cardiffensis F0333]
MERFASDRSLSSSKLVFEGENLVLARSAGGTAQEFRSARKPRNLALFTRL